MTNIRYLVSRNKREGWYAKSEYFGICFCDELTLVTNKRTKRRASSLRGKVKDYE